MRRPSIYADRRSGLEIKMTPMIDVVFLLLVFFVWTASFQVVEHILPSSLSAASGNQSVDVEREPTPDEDFDPIVVRVTWLEGQPNWRFNDLPIASLEQLQEKMQQLATLRSDAAVILHPDKEVPLGHVIDVFDIARGVGFDKVQFAASEPI